MMFCIVNTPYIEEGHVLKPFLISQTIFLKGACQLILDGFYFLHYYICKKNDRLKCIG